MNSDCVIQTQIRVPSLASISVQEQWSRACEIKTVLDLQLW